MDLEKIVKSKARGFLGEVFVAGVLKTLPSGEYLLLNDVMLPAPFGTTQIDHIIISIYGIFVVETKTYSGMIAGSEYGEQWTEYRHGGKYPFRNPLKQNYAHIKALEDVLGYSKDVFFPIVAFSGECSLKVTSEKPVIYIRDLKETILAHTEKKFSAEELPMIEKKIKKANVNGLLSKISHNRQVKEKIQSDDEKIKNGICPKCGGNLVERKGKYGGFLGCSNYPECRFTHKIQETPVIPSIKK